jgi:hypothetical protein
MPAPQATRPQSEPGRHTKEPADVGGRSTTGLGYQETLHQPKRRGSRPKSSPPHCRLSTIAAVCTLRR